MNQLLLGAIAMSCLVASLFFLRSWKRTGDRLFVFFAASFFIEGINRAMLGMSNDASEERPLFYIIRLFSFVLIVVAIVDKNLADAPRKSARKKESGF